MAQLMQDIIARAKTFRIFRWQYRSLELFNPYVLASQGYQCEQLNTLQCHVCHNKVVFTTSTGEERKQQQVIKQLSDHDTSCSYYQQAGIRFTKPQLYIRMDDLIKNVKQSYQNQEIDKLLPFINYEKFKERIRQNNQSQMFQMILNRSKIDSRQIKISFILTILGWGKKNKQEIECQFCGRWLNVKQFKTTTEDKQKNDTNFHQNQLFDPFKEHRYFCFWVHQLNGWEIYVQHLYDKLGQSQQLFKGKDPESLKKIRVLIDSYLQNFKTTTTENFQKINKVLQQCSELAQAIQETQESREQYIRQALARKKKMEDFVEQIENQVRKPLKMIKID